MKNLLLIAVLLLSSSVASANEQVIEQACSTTLKFAEFAVKGKQSGVPLSKMLETKEKLIEKFGEDAEVTGKIFQWMIDDAYKLPNLSSEKEKNEQLRNFTEGQYFACKDSLNREMAK